ncbi:MAG: hypothetical protein DRN35_00200 [Thermoplasmata archaeon]|nr:MAG: hypothetical protein DRN35_00200 [Thermoplasmata archaeon]RLF74186.1 MAG: hypothetical protein DRN55_00935 [Thermoplasmata archaeon]RLF76413.1 MAG: hypothetical protein DRN42_01065 [Thermoplasmata archaeon]HDD59331.1 hypothetical protein [Euryarchaeota archaeon]
MAKIRLKITKSKNKMKAEKTTKKKGRAARKKGEDTEGFDFSDIEDLIKELPKGGREEGETLDSFAGYEGDLDRRIKDVEGKIGRLETEISTVRGSLEAINKKIVEIEANIRKLLDIYELVIKEINPFVEPGPSKIWGDAERKMPTAPSEKLDELDLSDIELVTPEGRKEGMDERMGEGLEGSKELPIPKLPSLPSPSMKRGDSMEKDDLMSRVRQGKPILERLPMDYRTMILVFRWIEFLFERVTREKIGMLLEYYKDVGWISDEVKSKVMAFARGEVQDPTKYEPAEGEPGPELFDKGGPPMYKRVSDWRLSADDHLKSLLFILKIAGTDVNKDIFNAIEQEIKTFKQNLEEYYGV